MSLRCGDDRSERSSEWSIIFATADTEGRAMRSAELPGVCASLVVSGLDGSVTAVLLVCGKEPL